MVVVMEVEVEMEVEVMVEELLLVVEEVEVAMLNRREQESYSVCSFKIDSATGMPVFAGQVSTGDAKPCNVAPMPQ